MIFVDTSAWYAVCVPGDRDHTAACAWLDKNTERLLTTDYVVDELLTLLRMRGQYRRALRIGQRLMTESVAQLEWVSQADAEAAWDVFRNFADKDWSFTDCVSRVVMERLAIQTAFAFDDDFRQFGTVTVVPA